MLKVRFYGGAVVVYIPDHGKKKIKEVNEEISTVELQTIDVH